MLQDYCLADLPLIDHCKGLASGVEDGYPELHFAMQYVPRQMMVVLGASNNEAGSVFGDVCEMDAIPLIKRPSGGEAVLISADTLLFSHGIVTKSLPKSSVFFTDNLSIIQISLEKFGVRDLRYNGISDLCIGDRKILGCAIYRRPGMVLFQAVLNVALDPELIARYLRQPSRMPDYRKDRPHSEFVTSLLSEGYNLAPQDIDIVGTLRQTGISLSPVS